MSQATATRSRLELEQILELYSEYRQDLKRVRRYQRLLHHHRYDEQRSRAHLEALATLGSGLLIPGHLGQSTTAQFDDIEAETTYLLLRSLRPEQVVEVSPHGGWSTSWILNALHDNEHGSVRSFDLIDASLAKVPQDLSEGRHEFVQGDVRTSCHLPESIDFLLLDSDHSAAFGRWACENLFPRVRSGGCVAVHDVFHEAGLDASGGEGPVVLEWLQQRGIPFFAPGPVHHRPNYDRICAHRQSLGIELPICASWANTALFFTMP